MTTRNRAGRARALGTWLMLGVLLALSVVGAVVQLVPDLRSLYLLQDLTAAYQPPLSEGYLLGTDNLGRDLFWRVVAGLSVSVWVSFAVAVVSVILGLLLGVVAGFFGRLADATATVLVDVTWAFPALLLAVVLAGSMGVGLLTVVLALALTGWASFARIIRGEVLTLRERDYIHAASVLGVPKWRISARHLLPNLMPVTIVMMTFFVSTSVAAEAGLSFLGLGAQPPTPSLGVILADGRNYLTVSPWPVVIGGMALAAVVLLFNSLGDQLRDRLDPRARSRP
ncbi:MAG: ABC transporter permease [Acidimicrobiales bacterium]|nr:ABC transporter permease [Acidimicrobiales bacterium]